MKIIDIVANYKNKNALILEALIDGEDIDFFYDIPEGLNGELFLMFKELHKTDNTLESSKEVFSKIFSLSEYWEETNIKHITSNCTALQMSLSMQDYQTAQFLIDNGADPMKMNSFFIIEQLRKASCYSGEFISFCFKNNLFDLIKEKQALEFVNFFLFNGESYIKNNHKDIIFKANTIIQYFFNSKKIQANSFDEIILMDNYCDEVYKLIKVEQEKNNIQKYLKKNNIKTGVKI